MRRIEQGNPIKRVGIILKLFRSMQLEDARYTLYICYISPV